MDGLSETSVLKDKYNVTKRIYRDDFSSIYIVQEVRSKKTYTLKEMFHNVNDSISQTVIRELTRVAEKGVKLDKNPDSPRIVDFFLYKGKSYIVLDYKDEKSIERLMLYPTLGKTLRDRYVTVRGIASGGLEQFIWFVI